jgi:hypothetical protein
MFKLVKERRAWWPVKWMVPAEDGGKGKEVSIELQFRIKSVDELIGVLRAAETLGNEPDILGDATSMSVAMARAFSPMIADWRGVGDEDGQALAFSQDGLETLFNMPGVFDAALRAYKSCVTGTPETRLKN